MTGDGSSYLATRTRDDLSPSSEEKSLRGGNKEIKQTANTSTVIKVTFLFQSFGEKGEFGICAIVFMTFSEL